MKVDPVAQQRLGTMLFYGIAIVLAYFTYRILDPFLVPLMWAAVLAIIAHPTYERLAAKWGPNRAAAVATVGVTLVLIVPTLAAGYAFVEQGIQTVHKLQASVAAGHFNWVNELWKRLQQRFSSARSVDLAATLQRYAEEAATYIATQLGTILAHLTQFLFEVFVTVIGTFYFFRDGHAMLMRLRDILPFLPGQRERMLSDTRDLIFASVISSGAGALVDGALIGAMFAATGVGSPIFWGVMIAFFSFVPVIGSAVIWVPASAIMMAEGNVTRGIFLLFSCFAIVMLVDYWFRPWLISGRGEMGGLAVFVGVVGGIFYFGLIGIILGPIILALLASLLDLYTAGSRHGNRLAKASEA